MSEWRELNPLPLGPEPSVLPMNYTPLLFSAGGFEFGVLALCGFFGGENTSSYFSSWYFSRLLFFLFLFFSFFHLDFVGFFSLLFHFFLFICLQDFFLSAFNQLKEALFEDFSFLLFLVLVGFTELFKIEGCVVSISFNLRGFPHFVPLSGTSWGKPALFCGI